MRSRQEKRDEVLNKLMDEIDEGSPVCPHCDGALIVTKANPQEDSLCFCTGNVRCAKCGRKYHITVLRDYRSVTTALVERHRRRRRF
jgi:DNA-directed RNA polymerase subunit M/transcription elongation factor TFIIS